MFRRFASLCVIPVLLALSVPAHAQAFDIYGILLKVGARGGPNIPLLTEAELDASLYPYTPYTRYLGLGWNAGGVVHLRIFDLVAIEAGYMWSTESASGTIELEGVSDCRGRTAACPNLEIEQTFERTAHHFPIVLQAHLPLGRNASLFASGGIDIVRRINRSLSLASEDPFPGDLNPNDAEDAQLLASWNNDGYAQNLLRAEFNPNTPETVVGITGGAGINIQTRQVEIPVEFRFTIYPAAGGLLSQRGDFGSPCPDAELCPYDPASAPPRYNDTWSAQFFVLFGLDYVLF